MSNTLAALLAVAVAAGIVPGPLTAQSEPRREEPAGELARSIAHRSRIRVRLVSNSVVELQNATVDGTALTGRLATGIGAGRYEVGEIAQVWRRGNAAGLGLAIGAGVGFVGGAIGGIALASWGGPFGGHHASGDEVLAGAVIGGAVGGAALGVVGGLVGIVSEHWKNRVQVRATAPEAQRHTSRAGNQHHLLTLPACSRS